MDVRSGLVAVLAVLAVASAGCAPDVVPLEDLAVEMQEYDGEEVTTHGVVAEFDEDDGALEHHYVIQDGDANRVQLVPDDAAAPHVGDMTEVVGTFEFDPDRGRLLHIESIEPVEG